MTDIHTILNCSLQRFLKNNLGLSILLFLPHICIYVCFRLWYRFDSLVVENYKNNDIKNNNDSKKETS